MKRLLTLIFLLFLGANPAAAGAHPSALLTPLIQAEPGPTPHNLNPRQVIEAVVQAHANRDFEGMARLMAHDDKIVNYTLAGYKFVGWEQFKKFLEKEFQRVERLEIPIRELKVWVKEDKGYAWFSMEFDYIRFVRKGDQLTHNRIPLRKTGVLEKLNGEWILVSWHESRRAVAKTAQTGSNKGSLRLETIQGQWLIEEEERFYCATLDHQGNGTYNWQDGRIVSRSFQGRKWTGTWHQPGNDREGGFEITFSTNGNKARGRWWYERVEQRTIPPRKSGGPYIWTRMEPGSPCTQ